MEKHSIYVTTGTSEFNFDRMLDLVESMLKIYPNNHEVILQYGKSNVKHLPNCKVSERYISREASEAAYRNSDLIFSHCGIGSIFNSLKFNRPTVLIPRYEKHREFTDDHQLQIAKELSSNKLVYVVEDGGFTENAFLKFLEINQELKKEEIDLTNYKLADFIKSRLYS